MWEGNPGVKEGERESGGAEVTKYAFQQDLESYLLPVEEENFFSLNLGEASRRF